MTLAEVLEQVRTWNNALKKELLKEVIDMMGEDSPTRAPKTGAEIVAMMEALDAPIELVDPEIEDPVEWVKAQRRKRTI